MRPPASVGRGAANPGPPWKKISHGRSSSRRTGSTSSRAKTSIVGPPGSAWSSGTVNTWSVSSRPGSATGTREWSPSATATRQRYRGTLPSERLVHRLRAFSERRPMRFSTFHLFHRHDGQSFREVYDYHLELIELAEELGFHGVRLAEHHFRDYGVVPNLF